MIKKSLLPDTDRRAMILLAVLVLLTLFTILGITFVYLSDSYMATARMAREAESRNRPDIDPELALSYILGQLIYDTNDDNVGVMSSLRGWSLAQHVWLEQHRECPE